MLHADAEIDADLVGFLDVGFAACLCWPASRDELRDVAGSVCAIDLVSGWSGASATKLAPNSVSGRVVKTSIGRHTPATGARNRAAERKRAPCALADPVALHHADLVRPALEPVERRQQVVAVPGDAEEPLFEFALFNDAPERQPRAIDDLFVGEDGVLDRIPVHLRRCGDRRDRSRASSGRCAAGARSSSARRW